MHKHIVLLFGEDSFQVHEKLNAWKQAFIAKYGGDVNMDDVEGKLPPHELLSLTQSVPFLSEKRLVLVKNFLQEQDKDSLKKMTGLLDQVPDTCTLIFVESTPPDRRTAFFKALEKTCRLEECRPFSENQAIPWIQAKAQAYDSSIDPATAAILFQLFPKDSWKLANEVQKLALYATPNPITEVMINTLSQGELESSVFKLTDALGQKNTEDAIRILHELVHRGEELPMIFGMLARQIRLMLQIQDAKAHGITQAPQIAAKIKQHPYAVKVMLSQTGRFPFKQLVAMHRQLVSIDRSVKTGDLRFTTAEPTEYLLALEKFLIEATQPAL